MQVNVFKSTDGKYFENFKDYKAHEESILIKAKLAEVSFNTSAFQQDDRGNDVIYPENVAEFVTSNADLLREILGAAVVAQRKPRGPNKAKAAA